jgi:hypothetical protein
LTDAANPSLEVGPAISGTPIRTITGPVNWLLTVRTVVQELSVTYVKPIEMKLKVILVFAIKSYA